MRRRPRRLLVTALLAALGAGTCSAPRFTPRAGAQEVADTPRYRSNRPYESEVQAKSGREESAFHVAGGLDVRDQYFFRGYNRASSGVIVQPYFDLLYTVYKEDGVAITPHAGAWFNFTEEKGPENPQHWNEFRPSVGVAVDVDRLTLDFLWVMYKSPSEIFQRSEEIGATVAYHDRGLWPASFPFVALNPSVAYFSEYYDKNDSESDSYFGIALEPELRPFDVGKTPVTLSFPLTFGGSWDGYYFTDSGGVDQAGYWTAGIKASCPFPGQRRSSNCRLEAEVDYIRLMADSVERANGGDNDDVTLRVGLTFRM